MTFYTNRADIISLVFYQTLVNIVLLIASLISQSYIRPKKIFYIGNMPQETVDKRNTLEHKIFFPSHTMEPRYESGYFNSQY